MFSIMCAMHWSMVRDILTDKPPAMLRVEGESGLLFLGRTAFVFLFWPIPLTLLLYYVVNNAVVPWLFEPK